jgi:hypothetical protein
VQTTRRTERLSVLDLDHPDRAVAPPETEKRMPLRPENIMTTLLLTAVMSLVLLGVIGVIAIAVWGSTDSTPLLVYLGGMVLLALKVILGMLQQELAHRSLLKTSEAAKTAAATAATKVEVAAAEIKAEVVEAKEKVAELARHTNGELTSAVKEAGEQARLGERDQVIGDLLGSEALAWLISTTADEAVKKAREGGVP